MPRSVGTRTSFAKHRTYPVTIHAKCGRASTVGGTAFRPRLPKVHTRNTAPNPHISGMTLAPALPQHLLDVRTIYLEPEVEGHERGREILARFPAAERIPVASHWRIPALRDADAEDCLRAKQGTLVLGTKRGLGFRPNGRSADFIAPSTSNGCAMACAYCYVARRKGHSNPVTAFVNIEEVCAARAIAYGSWRRILVADTLLIQPEFDQSRQNPPPSN